MRRVVLTLLILSALLLAGCSFGTDFVVINDSASPVEVSYRLKGMPPNNPFFQTGDPLKIESSHLRDSDPRWQVLFKDEYRLDIENRTVTVGLKPGEALRINEGGEWNEKYAGENFAIEELNIKGANGEVNLKGDRVYKSFVPVWRPFYAFGPPTTLLTLTYK